MTVFVANTNVLDLVGLKNELTGAFINNATVTVTIKTVVTAPAVGVEVAGQTWPLTLNYLSASDGNYRAFISEGAEFVPKKKYMAYVEANGGPNLVGHWEFKFTADARSVAEPTE